MTAATSAPNAIGVPDLIDAPRPPSSGGRLNRPTWASRLAKIPLYLLALTMVAPFYWMVISAFKPVPELTRNPPTWAPESPTANSFYDPTWVPTENRFGHVAGLFQRFEQVPLGYWRFMINSVVIAASIAVLALLIASLASYVLAKHKLPGRQVIFITIIASMMIPWQVTLIPNYLTMLRFDWLSTYQGYIVPALAKAFVVFFLVQYLRSIPDELIQAARVDGAGEWRIWWHVVLPMIRPALAAMAIFVVLGEWNNFLWPLIIVGDDELANLPVAMARMNSTVSGAANSGVLMAAALIASIPTITFFLLFQKHFTRGIAISGLKG
jgi:multiple sugar transport system permease protein